MTKKVVALFDLHMGWEYAINHLGYVKTAAHDPKIIKLVLKFIREFQPTDIVLGGDQWNNATICHWNSLKKIGVEPGMYPAEVKLLDSMLLQHLPDIPNKTLIIGNHDQHSYDLMEKQPQLGDLVDPIKILNLTQRDWKIIPNGGYHQIGKLIYLHGNTIGGKSGGTAQTSAKASVTAYQKSCRFGHHHTYSAYTLHKAHDAKDCKTGICVPACCSTNMAYAKNAPNQCLQGFNFGYIDSKGNFNDSVVIVKPDYSFICEGQEFRL